MHASNDAAGCDAAGRDSVLTAEPGSAEWNRLRWRAGRRGMRELDVLLARYLEHGWPAADVRERGAFLDLLELQDPDLARLLLAGTGLAGAAPTASRGEVAAAAGRAVPGADAVPVVDAVPAVDAALVAKLTDGRYARP